MHKRKYLGLLILISLFFTGCFWSKSKTGPLLIELHGALGFSQEVILSRGDGTAYLLNFDLDQRAEIQLKKGTWQVQAFARTKEGHVQAESKAVNVDGARTQTLNLELLPITNAKTRLQPEQVEHEWSLEGVHFTWQNGSGEVAPFEIWRRLQADSQAPWEFVATISAENRSYDLSGQRTYPYLYSLRQGTSFNFDVYPSPLVRSSGTGLGSFEFTWEFSHNFTAQPRSLSMVGFEFHEPALLREYEDLIAHFNDEASFARRHELLAGLDLEIKAELPFLREVLVEPKATSERSLEELSYYSSPEFYLEPNWIVTAGALPALNSALPWYLDYLRVPEAQKITRGDQNVRIAVLDTGINPAQLPTTAKVETGYNFIANNQDTRDDRSENNSYHGTKVSQAITSVIPEVSLLPVKVLDSTGKGPIFTINQGLLYASGLPVVEQGITLQNPNPAQIINLSLGIEDIKSDTSLQRTIELVARETQSVLIAASGNTKGGVREPGLYYPASYPQVIAVGTVLPSSGEPRRASYSHYGSTLDFVAPEVSDLGSGTSFSAALVSGVAGLLLAEGFAVEDLRSTLETTSQDLGTSGWDEEFGHGLVNAHWAVRGETGFLLRISQAGTKVYEQKLPLRGQGHLVQLPPGEYEVEAWLNLSDRSQPSSGDYYFQRSQLVVGNGELQKQHLDLSVF